MSKYATKEQLISIVQDMASKISVPTIGIGGGYAPIGTVISYMGVTAPQDYLACDGSTYNISAYSDLADFFESQFGSKNYFGGDGTTTFAVPDLRGEFLRGTGTNSHSGSGNGSDVGKHQGATFIPRISTVGTDSTHGLLQIYTDDSTYRGVTSADKTIETITHWSNIYSDAAGSEAGSNARFSTRPTNTSILWCIKAVNAGDVYSTDERVVGTWVDGSTLYQKMVTTGGSVPSGATLICRTVMTGYDAVLYTKTV